jgi:hypothetical protein
MDAVRRIADAVLYEGYVLWPYRASALKNQRRWTFGGVYPRAHSESREDDPWLMRTQCLVEGDDATTVDIGVRFLHVVARDVAEQTPDGLRPVTELRVGDHRHLSWDEAREREIRAPGLRLAGSAAPRRVAVHVDAGREEEDLRDATGVRAGVLVRSWEPLEGAVETSAERIADGLFRLTVTIANTSAWDGGPREQALRRTFCSAHTVLHASGGAFVSSTDPPPALREAVAACANAGTWPVLVGEPGERHTMLSSPIILEDHPRIAPESPGDLFDGGEVDQLLTLSILAMTDEEKADMRDADPRTREILERTEALTGEQLMALHGAIREFGLERR